MPKKKSPPANRPQKDSAPQPPDTTSPAAAMTIVGIAASAGGLDAFKALLSAMPGDTGMAFVLIPHLDPSHASLMAELIAPHAKMPVQEALDGIRIQADTVYVIPPNRNLEIKERTLHLSRLALSRNDRTPIDLFFRSLAADLEEKAVGIVLSGTGAHGTLGLRAIKAHGGMTMVQEPAEADFDQMPRSAIAADVADYILPVARMPEVLCAYLKHPYVKYAPEHDGDDESTDYLGRILALIQTRLKYNFKDYRKKMLIRRIHRRMSINHLEEPDSYITLLRENPDELRQLFQDFLICVSGFFREPEAYEVLAQQIIPELIRLRARDDIPIRVWIPACATGEEAYSIAMLCYEVMDRIKTKHPALQIFATDISESALKTARLGIYPESISADVSPERLRRFFTKSDEHYQVNKRLRETIMFATHNVISDTPFSRLDLICCRNLLIYLEPETQQRLLSLFHFALNDGGYLFLGASETVGRQIDLYEPVSKSWRIFRRIGPSRPERVEFPTGIQQTLYMPYTAIRETKPRITKIGALAQELLIDAYVPACVIINRKFEILYLHGPTHNYLSMPPGEPTHDLLAMAHEGLATRIRGLCYQVNRAEEGEAQGESPVARNGHYVHVRITVKEIRQPKDLEGLLLVTFDDLPSEAHTDTKVIDSTDKNSLIQQLEFELKSTREDLQSTIEELESSNEELKASNEEMMSMNEELQSVNEELETSKEELQSLNEELNTVNNQLEDKISELDKASNDLNNLLTSADITTLFLDTDLRIRRFTPSTVKLLNLMPSDISRPISDFAYKFRDDALLADAHKVLERLTPIDKHVWTEQGQHYLRRILPYRTMDNQIEGVVVSFVDITPQVVADMELKRAAELLKDSSVAILIKDLKGKITAWSHGAERMYGYTEAEALKMNALNLIPRPLRRKAQSITTQIARGRDIETIETQRVTKDGQLLDIALTAAPLTDRRGKVIGIIATEHNITERKRMEDDLLNINKELRQRVAVHTADAEQKTEQLHQREQYLSAIVNTDPNAIITADRAGIITSFNPAAERIFGYAPDEAIGQDSAMLFLSPPKTRQGGDWIRTFLPPKAAVSSLPREAQGRRKDATSFPMEVSVSEIDHLGFYLLVARDISAQRTLEKEIIDVSTQEQERIGQEIHDGLGQRLTALTMMTANLGKKLADLNKPEAALLKEYLKQLREASDEAHTLAQGLAPVPIDPSGLKVSLKKLADSVSASSGITCHLKSRRTQELNDRVQALQLYRITQEAVNNAVKHAKPDNITIDLAAAKGGITLKISDDGKGFDADGHAADGLGMHIMRYRANIIGAALEIHSERGKGTSIVCTLPRPTHPRKR